MMTVPLRSTVQISTLHLMMVFSSCSATRLSLLAASTRSSTISSRPRANESRRRNPGKLSSRSISMAACRSGFTISDSANTSRIW